jgi:serine/threonine-protein kinase
MSAEWADSNLVLEADSIIASSAPPSLYRPDDAEAPSISRAAPQELGKFGRYTLKLRIGGGGIGTVYAAHDPVLSRLVALKTLNIDVGVGEERESFNALFLNEARAAAALSHPYIVPVFDAGISDQGPYIAMELLRGRDLQQLRDDGWRPSPTQTVLIIGRVAHALAYAHSKGIVHRDIKPANIFMVANSQPRVLDFGIARVTDGRGVLKEGEMVFASPLYMSPEQAQQLPMDRRSDVFSLGVVLYEMLCNQRPFSGRNLEEITKSVVEGKHVPIDKVDPKLSPELARIVDKALEKNPVKRHQSASSLARDLREWLEDDRLGLNRAPVKTAATSWKSPRNLAVAGAAVAGAALVAWIALSPSSEPVRPPPLVTRPPAADTQAPLPGARPPQTNTAQTPAAQPQQAGANRQLGAEPRKEQPRRAELIGRDSRAVSTVGLPPNVGLVQLAISPFGHVEVNGRPAGLSPPLLELKLPEGRHQITVRYADFPIYSETVEVKAGRAVTLRHTFGS